MKNNAIVLFFCLPLLQTIPLLGQNFWVDAIGPQGINIAQLQNDPQGILYGTNYPNLIKTTFRSKDGGLSWDALTGPNDAPSINQLSVGLDGTVFCRGNNIEDLFYSKSHGDNWSVVNLPSSNYAYITSNSVGDLLATQENCILRSVDNLIWDTLVYIAPDTLFGQVDNFYFGKIGWISDGRIVVEAPYSFASFNPDISFFISADDGISWDTFLDPSPSPLGLTLMPNGKFLSSNDERQLCISNLGEAPNCSYPPFISMQQTPFVGLSTYFVTDSGRIIVSKGEEALSSDDEGLNWQPHPLEIAASITHKPLPGAYILSKSYYDGNTMRSVDLGQTWFHAGKGADRAWSYDWIFKTNEKVFAISNGLWRSLDGGVEWELVIWDSIDPTLSFYNLALAPNGDLYGLSNRGLFRSVDDGESFQFMETDPSFGKPYRVSVHPQTGDVYLSGEHLLRSTDHGQTWFVITTNQVFSSHPILFHPNGTFYTTTSRLIRSEDHGHTWTEVAVSPTSSYNYFDFVRIMPDGKIITVGPSGYGTSTDNGVSWKRRNVPISPGTLAINALGHGYIGDINEKRIFKTEDDGVTWTGIPYVPSTLFTGIIHVAMAPDQTLWVCTDGDGHFKSATPTVAVSNTNFRALEFVISPNPSDAFLHFSLIEPLSTDAIVSMYNAAGQLVHSWSLASGNTYLPMQVSNLPEGVYAVSIENEAVKGVKKVVIR